MEERSLETILGSEYGEDLLRQDGVYIRMESMPAGAPSVTMLGDEDCGYNVYLNSNMTRERNLVSLFHEIDQHIKKDDWHSDSPLSEIEFEARKGTGQI